MPPRWAAVAASLPLLLGACSSAMHPPPEAETQVPQADAGSPPARLPTGAEPQRLTGFLRDLSDPAMGGRLTGTASGDRAEKYLRDELAGAGLEIVTQEAEFPLYEVKGPARLEVLGQGAQPGLAMKYFEEYREIEFAGSGAVEGELVFVGYGLVGGGRDDYSGLEVSGRIVAILTGVPAGSPLDPKEDGRTDRKIHSAWQRGARGAVMVPAGSAAQAAKKNGLATRLGAIGADGRPDPALHREEFPAVWVRPEATEKLLGRTADQLAADPAPFATGKRVALEMHGVSLVPARCRNVLAVQRGTDASLGSEVVILGAHYDHLGALADGRVFAGAADNATGTAVVLEAARALAGSGVAPRRTVVYAFWCGEEQGLHGSLLYTRKAPLFPLEDTRLMIQVDFLGDGDGPYLTNVDDNPLVLAFLGNAMDDEEEPVLPLDYGGQCASDDCGFLWAHVPAYRFLAFGAHHHVPTDTFDRVRLETTLRVADVTIRGLGAVAYRPAR